MRWTEQNTILKVTANTSVVYSVLDVIPRAFHISYLFNPPNDPMMWELTLSHLADENTEAKLEHVSQGHTGRIPTRQSAPNPSLTLGSPAFPHEWQG